MGGVALVIIVVGVVGWGGLNNDLGHEFELRVVGWGGVVVGWPQ